MFLQKERCRLDKVAAALISRKRRQTAGLYSLEATYIRKKLSGISVLEAFSLAKIHKKTLSNDTRGVTT